MITPDQEQKIISLVQEIAKNILPIEEVLEQLNITDEEYDFICKTKAFKEMLASASSEWSSAGNTHKRAKLKAAAVIETVLPTFYNDMVNKNNKLADRAKVLETVSKIAGLGAPDAVTAPSGNVFRLQINLAANRSPITLSMGTDYSESSNGVINSDEFTKSESLEELEKVEELEIPRISQIFEQEELEDL